MGVQDQTISKPLRAPLGKAVPAYSQNDVDAEVSVFLLRLLLPPPQMLYIPAVWIRRSVRTPAEQPYTQSLHPSESCRLHAVQPTQLLSTPTDAAR